MNSRRGATLSVLVGVLVLVTHAHAAPTVRPEGVTIQEEGIAEGYALFGAQVGGVLLLDPDGTVVHSWNFPCGWQGPQVPLANGHVLNRSCNIIMEMDWDQTIVWEFAAPEGVTFHHDWERLPNGNTRILCNMQPWIIDPSFSPNSIPDDFILEVSPGGDIVWEWHAKDHLDEFGFSQERRDLIYERGGDWAHMNTISRIPDNTSHSDPRFAPGNIIISLRHQNTIAIIDRATGQIVWTLTDKTIGQHTTHMIPDDLPGGGKILAFDNGYAENWSLIPNRPFSQIVEIDPVTGSVLPTYTAESSGLPLGTFYSYLGSGAQRQSNGNTLIASTRFGRLFEVTADGQIVWEYIAPTGSTWNVIYRAYKVPLDWAGPYFVPDLVVSGDDDPDPVQAGDDLEYTIQVVNVGSDPAVNAELVEATPVGTTFQSISAPAAWDCSTPAVGGTGPITCTKPSLSAGSTDVLTMVVKVDRCVGDGTTIANTATASSLGSDATPGDNSTTIHTTAQRDGPPVDTPSIELSKGEGDLTISWGAVSGADSYDVMFGLLSVLQTSVGDFSLLEACLANDDPSTSHQRSLSAESAPEFFLVRAVNCGEHGTGDSLGPGQVEPRDGEIAISGVCQ